jgi:hypothetical protein
MPPNWGNSPHEYAVEFTPEFLAFVYDGETVSVPQVRSVRHWIYTPVMLWQVMNLTDDGNVNHPRLWDVPYYLILNTVGCPWCRALHFSVLLEVQVSTRRPAPALLQAIGGPWPKPVNASTIFPTRFAISSVRVVVAAAT